MRLIEQVSYRTGSQSITLETVTKRLSIHMLYHWYGEQDSVVQDEGSSVPPKE